MSLDTIEQLVAIVNGLAASAYALSRMRTRRRSSLRDGTARSNDASSPPPIRGLS
jgi:hypothetical protein